MTEKQKKTVLLRTYIKLTLSLVLLVFGLSVNAQDIPSKPNPPKLVNDFAGVLSSSEIQSLETKLVAFDDSTSNQIAVVIVRSVEPYDMNSYAVKLGREWGVGHDGKNNGIVLLWASDDRKVYIATGYGLEGGLPDAYAKRVVDRIIIPYFKEARFYEGLDAGSTAIMKYVSGEFEAEAGSENGEFPLWAFILMIVLVVTIIKVISKGGGGGGGLTRSGRSPWGYTTVTGWGNHSGNWTGGGGFGGGSGGGFGGFGGGSFGGGGAGGSY
ncbi:MAG: hypothetical protein ACI9IP_002069 [Arcticibacterium sp.]|jgi:uncharacterized protein